jgi:Xaa-Pro dipeptidase
MIDLKRTWAMMEENHLDALIASSPQNVFYTSGFPYHAAAENRIFFLLRNIGPLFTILPKGGNPILVSPNSGRATAERFCFIKDQHFYNVSPPKEMVSASQSRKATFAALQALQQILIKLRIGNGRIGIEGLDLPINFYAGLKEMIAAVEWIDAQDIFFRMRSIKQPDEVDRIRRATQFAMAGLEAAFAAIHEGATELEILNTYKGEVVRQGGVWCNTKYCGGRVNGATISHQASDYRMRPGDPAIFDVGAICQGYTTDLARVGYLKEAEREGTKLYEVLRSGQEMAIKAMKPGVPISEIFAIGQNHVRESGYPEYTRGNIGHGVGIDFEEEPFIGPDNLWNIEEGMMLALEVPFYSSKLGGFNVEDMVYITKKGPEVLSSSLRKDVIICR